jgi:hypothetical protein
MGELLKGLLLLFAFLAGIVLAVLGFALITATVAVAYVVLLSLSYPLTMALLLRATGPAGRKLVLDDRIRLGGEGREHADGGPTLDDAEPDAEEGDRLSVEEFLEPPQLRGGRRRAWLGKHEDEAIAEPSYYFGPVADDIEDVVVGWLVRCWMWFQLGTALVGMILDGSESGLVFVAVAGIFAGLIIGGLIGMAVGVVFALVNLVIAAITVLVALLIWAILRFVDELRRLIYVVQMPCPVCHKKVTPYPVYLCPSCAQPHQDIRPSPRGIYLRNCECTASFKTSMLTGAANLVARCPHCGTGLPKKFGKVPEIVIPFFGGLNVGKTQLMYTLTEALNLLVTTNGGTIAFEDDTEERLTKIGDDLKTDGKPAKTLRETPKAYTIRLKLGLEERLIFLFDAAGELHYSPSALGQLNYLDKARVLVYVADPLAADDVWAEIPEGFRVTLGDMRSSKAEGELAYQQTREHMRRMGGKRKYAKLALVVSKADVLEMAGITSVSGPADEAARDLVQRRRGLDMADEVREAAQSFAAVEFFHTSAILGDLGLPDGSVEELARWLMLSEGIPLRRWAE